MHSRMRWMRHVRLEIPKQSLHGGYAPDRFWVRITNPFRGESFDLSDVALSGLSSKASGRGQGLAVMASAAERLGFAFGLEGRSGVATLTLTGALEVATWLALVVEDDPEQMDFTAQIVAAAGFRVEGFGDYESATQYLESSDGMVDLVVVDRGLPLRIGEPVADEIGDELLRQFRARFPDARIVVFTAFADVPHVRRSMQGGGQLPPSRSGTLLDRVIVLEKDDSIEFEEELKRYAELLRELDDVDVAGPGVHSARDLRAFRRLTHEFLGMSVQAEALGGGLSGASVWKCELRGQAQLVAEYRHEEIDVPTTAWWPTGLVAEQVRRGEQTPP